MCLILFAYKQHKDYPLIVAANRDEFFDRPTEPVHFWHDFPEILAGRDLEKGGTWMGVTKAGRFAAITNYRDPKEIKKVYEKSRGELVKNALIYPGSIQDYMDSLIVSANQYPGYNLLVGDEMGLYYFSNKEKIVKKLQPGIYGLSNHLLNTPWPKVVKGKAGLEKIIRNENSKMESEMFQLLQFAEPFPDEQLPNTGVSLEMERMLSPLFIKSDNYGTRSSTILLKSGQDIQYIEKITTPNWPGPKVNRFHFHYSPEMGIQFY